MHRVLNPVTALAVVTQLGSPAEGWAEHSHHDREGTHSEQQPLDAAQPTVNPADERACYHFNRCSEGPRWGVRRPVWAPLTGCWEGVPVGADGHSMGGTRSTNCRGHSHRPLSGGEVTTGSGTAP